MALTDAGLQPADIDHVSAHGTSTPANDACEAMALKQVFGERIAQLPITANKSALGHSLANSGAVEAVLSVLSLQHQVLLPTLNYQQPLIHRRLASSPPYATRHCARARNSSVRRRTSH